MKWKASRSIHTIEPEPLRKERPPRKPRQANADADAEQFRAVKPNRLMRTVEEKPRQQRAESRVERRSVKTSRNSVVMTIRVIRATKRLAHKPMNTVM